MSFAAMPEASQIPHAAKIAQEMVENAGGFASSGLATAASLLAKQTPKPRSLNKATKMRRSLNEAFAIHRHFTSKGCSKWLAELKVALDVGSDGDPLQFDDPWAGATPGQSLPRFPTDCDDPWARWFPSRADVHETATAGKDGCNKIDCVEVRFSPASFGSSEESSLLLARSPPFVPSFGSHSTDPLRQLSGAKQQGKVDAAQKDSGPIEARISDIEKTVGNVTGKLEQLWLLVNVKPQGTSEKIDSLAHSVKLLSDKVEAFQSPPLAGVGALLDNQARQILDTLGSMEEQLNTRTSRLEAAMEEFKSPG